MRLGSFSRSVSLRLLSFFPSLHFLQLLRSRAAQQEVPADSLRSLTPPCESREYKRGRREKEENRGEDRGVREEDSSEALAAAGADPAGAGGATDVIGWSL